MLIIEFSPAHTSSMYSSEQGLKRQTGCSCTVEHILATTCCCQRIISNLWAHTIAHQACAVDEQYLYSTQSFSSEKKMRALLIPVVVEGDVSTVRKEVFSPLIWRKLTVQQRSLTIKDCKLDHFAHF